MCIRINADRRALEIQCGTTQPRKSFIELKLNLTQFNIYAVRCSKTLVKISLCIVLSSFMNCLLETYLDRKMNSVFNFDQLEFSELQFGFDSMIRRYYCIFYECIYDSENDKHQRLGTLSFRGLEVITLRFRVTMTINSTSTSHQLLLDSSNTD